MRPCWMVICAVARDHALVGADADEGVAADVLAAFDGFEEEGFGFSGGDAEESGDGGFEVGGDDAVDGDERVRALRELLEVAEGGEVLSGRGGIVLDEEDI